MNDTAKEAASRFIGKWGILVVFALVCVAVYSASSLSSEALTPVIGLVATASMAIIGMLSGITGTKDKEEKPEFQVIQHLIAKLAEKEPPMRVDVEDGKVTVRKGDDVTTTTTRKD